jgi:hypothetical protein
MGWCYKAFNLVYNWLGYLPDYPQAWFGLSLEWSVEPNHGV